MLCISDRLSISASIQIMNIRYQKTEKFDIGTPLTFGKYILSMSEQKFVLIGEMNFVRI